MILQSLQPCFFGPKGLWTSVASGKSHCKDDSSIWMRGPSGVETARAATIKKRSTDNIPAKCRTGKCKKKHHSLCWFNSSFEMNQSLWERTCRHSACFIVRKTVWNFNLPGANCGFVCQYDTCWMYVAWESFEIVPVNAKGWMILSTSSPTKNTNPLNLSWQAQKLSNKKR